VLDHARMWHRGRRHGKGRRWTLTSEPYHLEGGPFLEFVEWCRSLGLRVWLSGRSPYFPGQTLLLVVERADEYPLRV
jgi:hypothetical protein